MYIILEIQLFYILVNRVSRNGVSETRLAVIMKCRNIICRLDKSLDATCTEIKIGAVQRTLHGCV